MLGCSWPYVIRNGRYERCGISSNIMFDVGESRLCCPHYNMWRYDVPYSEALHRRVPEDWETVTYFLSRGEYVKIGRTRDLDTRISQIRQGGCIMPDGMVVGPVKLESVIQGDVEKKMHRAFSDLRTTGEWFFNFGRLREFIEDLGDDEFVAEVGNRRLTMEDVVVLNKEFFDANAQ